MVADDEDVLRARLRYVAVDVEHEGLIGTVLIRLYVGYDVVQVVQGLDGGADALRWNTPIRGRHDLEAALVHLAEEIDARLRDDDDARTRLAFPRVQAEVPGTARDDRPDVPFLDVVVPACFEDDVRELLLCVRDLEVDRLRTVEEPIHVALEFEHAAVVRPNPFEDPVSVQEAVVEDADLRLGLREEFAVNVDTQIHRAAPDCVCMNRLH